MMMMTHAQAAAYAGKVGTILLLCDHAGVRRSIGGWLLDQGYQVIAVSTLEQARAVLRSTQPDSVVIDLAEAITPDQLAYLGEHTTRRLVFLAADDPESGASAGSKVRLVTATRPIQFDALTAALGGSRLAESAEMRSRAAALETEVRRLHQERRDLQDSMAFTGHEWKNALTRLGLLASRMANTGRQDADERLVAMADQLHVTLALMERIARNYLDTARLDSGALAARRKLVDPVKDILEPLRAHYADALAAQNQTLRISPCREDLLVWADPDLLCAALENLIANAIKYGAAGGKIIVSLMERGNGDEITVWNSGPGLAPEAVERLFDRFTRADDQDHLSGHGIGLYLTRRIVEAHGGHLWVESQAGEWISFTFTLPRRGRYTA